MKDANTKSQLYNNTMGLGQNIPECSQPCDADAEGRRAERKRANVTTCAVANEPD